MPYSKYSDKQKKLAAIAEPRKKITAADLKKATRVKGMMCGGSVKKMKSGGKCGTPINAKLKARAKG